MIEWIKLQLLATRAELKQLNEALEKKAHHYTIGQLKLIYDTVKELELKEKDLLAQIQAAETAALSEALNPPDPVVGGRKKPLVN